MADTPESLSTGPQGQPIGSPAPGQGEHEGPQTGSVGPGGLPIAGIPPARTPADSPANRPDASPPRGDLAQPGQPYASPPPGVELAPAPEVTDGSKFHYAGTDKNVDDPADANDADIEAALGDGPWEAAPQPFRKRDGFPDLTQESVVVRFDRDYYPADRERFQTPIGPDGVVEPRARKDQLLALPSDEAIAVIEAGIAHREDEYAAERADEQRKRWADRDADAERVKEEARRRRDDDGA